MTGFKFSGVTMAIAALPDWLGITINSMFVLKPITVAMAIAGASLSYVWTDKRVDRKTMLRGIVWFSFLSVVATALAPEMLGAAWIDEKQAPFAGALAAIMQNLWPMFKNKLPELFDKVTGTGAYAKHRILQGEEDESISEDIK